MARVRRSRSRVFRGSDGRPSQWFGLQASNIIVDSDAIDNFIVVPTSGAISEQSKGTLVATHIQSTIASANVARATNQTLIALIQKTETTAAGTPVNILDPSTVNVFEMGNGDVLGWWHLPTPETTPGDANLVTFKTSVFQSRAKRKISRRMHAICWTVTGFDTLDLNATFFVRCLVKY